MKKNNNLLKEQFLSVDELNNMHVEDLEELESVVWTYFKRVKAVLVFTQELNKEE